VLDRLLPDGDGFDLIARWRQTFDRSELAIVVVSVRQEAALARRLGANASLAKPVEPAAVLAEVERLLAAIASPAEQAVSSSAGTAP
jgi:DNA-binding response OmpR family regulator